MTEEKVYNERIYGIMTNSIDLILANLYIFGDSDM